MEDEQLLAKAEEALTEIKVNQGLAERHEAVLAALRIRLKGSDLEGRGQGKAVAGRPTGQGAEEARLALLTALIPR